MSRFEMNTLRTKSERLPACILSMILTRCVATIGVAAFMLFAYGFPAISGDGSPLLRHSQAAQKPRADVPTPPPRPADLTPPQTTETRPQDAAAPTEATCTQAMTSGRLVAVLVAPVVGPDQCGIAAPLKLSAIILADGARVPIEPESLLQCDFAEALADWVREDIAPLAQIAGGGLAKILGSGGYECRSRNRMVGGIISEHAKGNALDLRGFKLHNGRTLLIESANEDLDFMTQLRDTSCARFTTVLGPGEDGYHQTHMHVDLKARRNGYRVCQWDLE
jgi:hypothetical protein